MKTKAIPLVFMFVSALLAQDPASPEPRWTVNVGAGFTNPVRGIESRLDRGWNFSAGGGPRFTRNLSLVGEFNYTEMNLSQAALTALSMPDGNTRMWSLTANPRVNFNPEGLFDLYLIGGGGVYRRTVEFTQPTVTTITVFDPWWGVLYPAAVPANEILASYSTTRGGLNIGGGITVRLGSTGVKFYSEARYHHMFTPGVATTYLPVTFGLQW